MPWRIDFVVARTPMDWQRLFTCHFFITLHLFTYKQQMYSKNLFVQRVSKINDQLEKQ